jgi:glycosyltransferase involved in cell wall biosynthesis
MAKFLVIHPNMDIYGGGERVCHHIIKTLISHGQQVELLAFDFDLSRYKEIMGEKLPDRVAVHMLGNRATVEADPPLSVYKRGSKILALLKKYKASTQYDYTFSTQTISAFETSLFQKAKANIAYVHFPEIHYDYVHSRFSKRLYLWLYKRLLERDIGKLDLVFVNSDYTKGMTEKYWSKFGVKKTVVAYPPVEAPFWSNKPLNTRVNRVVYIARFIPQKRHEILKLLATNFPQFQFVSIGLLRDTEEAWFKEFSKDLPPNYTLKPNLPEKEKIRILQDSTIYCHLMEGEHFGIAPMEALASGCMVFVHDSGGSGEFVPANFRWNTIEDVKLKISEVLASPKLFSVWENQIVALRNRISVLQPDCFEDQIWSNLATLMASEKP